MLIIPNLFHCFTPLFPPLASAATLLNLLTSGTAIIIYIVIILISVFILSMSVMFGGSKEQSIEYTQDTTPTPLAPVSTDSDKQTEEEEETVSERFCMLCEIDRNKNKYSYRTYEKGITLQTLCEDFRNYAASRLGLYYDIEDIRRFIAGLAVSRLVILQGMSGTGKTSLAHAFGSFIDNTATVIPVQPMWKERTDLIGYYNEFTKRFNETLLLEKMYEANYSKDIYVTVLDAYC